MLAVASIVGVLAAPALASAPPGGASSDATVAAAGRGVTYGGSTSARDPIMIRLSRDGRRVTQVSQQFEAKCDSGRRYSFVVLPAASIRIDSRGRFRSRLANTTDLGDGIVARETATVSGTVNRLKLSGSSKLHVDLVDPAGTVIDTCHRAVTFRAAAVPKKVFAGVTSRRRPIVIELAASARSVRDFHIGWRAPCTPDGTLVYGDTLTDFPINRGRFGDDFTQTFSGPEGNTTVAYSVRGRITGRDARGTFRLKVTTTDATGATTTCDTGALTYTTTSG